MLKARRTQDNQFNLKLKYKLRKFWCVEKLKNKSIYINTGDLNIYDFQLIV